MALIYDPWIFYFLLPLNRFSLTKIPSSTETIKRGIETWFWVEACFIVLLFLLIFSRIGIFQKFYQNAFLPLRIITNTSNSRNCFKWHLITIFDEFVRLFEYTYIYAHTSSSLAALILRPVPRNFSTGICRLLMANRNRRGPGYADGL